MRCLPGWRVKVAGKARRLAAYQIRRSDVQHGLADLTMLQNSVCARDLEALVMLDETERLLRGNAIRAGSP